MKQPPREHVAEAELQLRQQFERTFVELSKAHTELYLSPTYTRTYVLDAGIPDRDYFLLGGKYFVSRDFLTRLKEQQMSPRRRNANESVPESSPEQPSVQVQEQEQATPEEVVVAKAAEAVRATRGRNAPAEVILEGEPYLKFAAAAEFVGVAFQQVYQRAVQHKKMRWAKHNGLNYVRKADIERWKESYTPRASDSTPIATPAEVIEEQANAAEEDEDVSASE